MSKDPIFNRVKRAFRRFFNVGNERKFFNKLMADYKDFPKIYKGLKSTPLDSYVAFFFWWDGFENLPPLCRVCYESIKKYIKPGFKIVFIDKDNYQQYVHLPQFIIEKHSQKIISHTHFSDILRTCLLCEHGGLWIDSSVYLTGKIYDDVYSSDLFVFKGPSFKSVNCEVDGSNISSWFIFANKSHPILLSVRDMLFSYWEQNNKLIVYKLFHWFFTIASREHIDDWYNIVYYPTTLPHYLYFSIFNRPYNERMYKRALELSNIHKLSWHNEPVIGSFHEKLLTEKIVK